MHEGSLKGVRKGKRKLGDGSQDLDSSYTADGDEPWLGSHNADGVDEHASKRHKVTSHLSRSPCCQLALAAYEPLQWEWTLAYCPRLVSIALILRPLLRVRRRRDHPAYRYMLLEDSRVA